MERLLELHPAGPLDFNKDFYPSLQQSAEFWESCSLPTRSLFSIHMEGLGRPSDPPVAKLLLGPAAYVPCCTAAKLPLVRLSCRAANLPSSTWMFPLRLQ